MVYTGIGAYIGWASEESNDSVGAYGTAADIDEAAATTDDGYQMLPYWFPMRDDTDGLEHDPGLLDVADLSNRVEGYRNKIYGQRSVGGSFTLDFQSQGMESLLEHVFLHRIQSGDVTGDPRVWTFGYMSGTGFNTYGTEGFGLTVWVNRIQDGLNVSQFSGCKVGSTTFSFEPNQPATIACDVVGQLYDAQVTDPASGPTLTNGQRFVSGGYYSDSGTVGKLTLDQETGIGVDYVARSVSISINHNFEERPTLQGQFPAEPYPGRPEITLEATVELDASSAVSVLNWAGDNVATGTNSPETFSAVFGAINTTPANDHKAVFTLPTCHLVSGGEPQVSGPGVVTMDLTFKAAYATLAPISLALTNDNTVALVST